MNMSKIRLFVCSIIFLVFVGGSRSLATGVLQHISYGAEFVTALGRSMAMMADELKAAGSDKADYVRFVADVARVSNVLLGIINHHDDGLSPFVYSSYWLAFDFVNAVQFCMGEGYVQPTPYSQATPDDTLSVVANALQCKLLPALEPLLSAMVAGSNWAKDQDDIKKWRVRVQSLASLSRMIKFALEYRNEPEGRYFLALAIVHVMVTAYELFHQDSDDLRTNVDKNRQAIYQETAEGKRKHAVFLDGLAGKFRQSAEKEHQFGENCLHAAEIARQELERGNCEQKKREVLVNTMEENTGRFRGSRRWEARDYETVGLLNNAANFAREEADRFDLLVNQMDYTIYLDLLVNQQLNDQANE